MMTSASFADGKMVTVCEEHYFRHQDRAIARENAMAAKQEFIQLDKEANRLRRLADGAMDRYYAAKGKIR